MRTAVELLEDTLYAYLNKEDKKYTDVLFNKAKEMEEEQKMDFANWCRIHDNKHPNQVWAIQDLFEKYQIETIKSEIINCKHESEQMRQGDGFVYVFCKDCGIDL
jgi:hypothetical protein